MVEPRGNERNIEKARLFAELNQMNAISQNTNDCYRYFARFVFAIDLFCMHYPT